MASVMHDSVLPRGAVIGAAALVGCTLLLVAGARLTGYRPETPPPSRAVLTRTLRFLDRDDGAVIVCEAGRIVDVLPPQSNGFVRSVLRGLARERRLEHLQAPPEFRLTRWADGRLSLDDPATARHIDLEVFGPTNAQAFAQILMAGEPADEPKEPRP